MDFDKVIEDNISCNLALGFKSSGSIYNTKHRRQKERYMINLDSLINGNHGAFGIFTFTINVFNKV